jgi:hypothetical protein
MVTAQCEESITLERPAWYTVDPVNMGETSVTISITVLTDVCDWCPPGEHPASGTDCTCVPVNAMDPIGTLYETSQLAQETLIVMNLDDAITIREWSV